MSGYPSYPGGYTPTYPATSSPGAPPGGPPAGQFLAALQAITTALNGQAAALNKLLTPAPPVAAPAAATNGAALTQFHLPEVTAPDPPETGVILYVDSSTHHLMAVMADGTRTTLA